MIAVVLGGVNWQDSSGNRVEGNYFSESSRLLEHGFNDFTRAEVLSDIDPVATIPVSLCAQQDYVTVQPAQALEATLPNGLDPALFDQDIDLPETLEAPIEKGQVLGTIRLSYEGRDFGTVDLIATTALERSQLLFVYDRVTTFFSHLWVKLVLLALVILALVLILRSRFGAPRRRNRYGGRSSRPSRSSYRGRRRR